MQQAIELIKEYRRLFVTEQDEQLPVLRVQLKSIGFYSLEVWQQDEVLKQAKHESKATRFNKATAGA